MSKPEVKSVMDKHFVIAELIVRESAEKKALENPGGEQVLLDSKGGKAGLPFFYLADAKGKMIVNSNSQKEGTEGNVGCPYEPAEIAWFMTMLSKARPQMTAGERKTVQTAFEALKKGG